MAPDVDVSRTGGRYLLAGDAFLFGGAFYLVGTSLVLGLPLLLGVDVESFGSGLGPFWGSALSLLASGLLVLMGAVVAWRMHEREIDAGVVGTMVVGAVAGIAASMAAFVGGTIALRGLSRLIIGPNQAPGPWVVLAVLAILVIALLAVVLVDGIRDLRSEQQAHVTLDWARLGSAAAIVLLGVVFLPVVTVVSGSEIGEAGAFMVPFAAGAAFAAVASDMLRVARARRHGTTGGLAAAP